MLFTNFWSPNGFLPILSPIFFGSPKKNNMVFYCRHLSPQHFNSFSTSKHLQGTTEPIAHPHHVLHGHQEEQGVLRGLGPRGADAVDRGAQAPELVLQAAAQEFLQSRWSNHQNQTGWCVAKNETSGFCGHFKGACHL